MKNKPTSPQLRSKVPSSRHVLIIILLGAVGLVATLGFLFNDLKLSAYSQQRWAIRDSSGQQVAKPLAQSPVIDTLKVAVDTLISVHKVLKNDTSFTHNIDFSAVYFNYHPALLVWMWLIAIMIACALALFPVTIKYICDIYKSCGLKRADLASAACFTFVIVCLILATSLLNHHMLNARRIIETAHILVLHPVTLSVFVVICLASAMVAVCGQFLTNKAITKLPDDIRALSAADQQEAASKFMLLRNSLKYFLMADAALIVFSVLTTDTLRRAIMANLDIKGFHIFPQEFVYLYGLAFTFYLAILYIPIYYHLKYKGAVMAQGLPAAIPTTAAISNSFLINESPVASLQVALSILAPVVSSLLPGLLRL